MHRDKITKHRDATNGEKKKTFDLVDIGPEINFVDDLLKHEARCEQTQQSLKVERMEYTKLLLIDSYDSFTHKHVNPFFPHRFIFISFFYSLASLCQKAIPNCLVFIIKNDQFSLQNLLPYLPYFSAVIIGPGPGSPDIPEDIGLVKDLWKLKEHDLLPIFGVCLGLQSLALEFGALLRRLDAVKHGQISHIYHQGIDLFDNVGSVRAVRYHSLHVVLLQDGDVEELAWADDIENGKVTMAVRHKNRPFWAVQYHPESVCTEGGGIQVVRNFWRLAQTWANVASREALPWDANIEAIFRHPWPCLPTLSPPRSSNSSLTVITSAVVRLGLLVTDVCESMGALEESSSFVLLDSASHPGRFSIVGCLSSSSLRITYRVGDRFISLTRDGKTVTEELGTQQDVWSWLATLMQSKKAVGGNVGLPFWGGLIGYLSYELGVNSIKISSRKNECTGNLHPDVNLVFVDRSIILDAETGRTFVQSILPGDEDWIAKTTAKLESLPQSFSTANPPHPKTDIKITLPDKTHYISSIKECQEHLFAGDSYELCLTAQTRISISDIPSSATSNSWERYKRLRKGNPAPHSAYLRLHPSTFLSSSPERFLSFSRPPGTVCQLRPIKGTVRKAPGITRAVAEQSLVGSPKEVAENLMIVDLIRHDLHGVVGDDVVVQQFCVVEEYETVWQLVSVIEGKLKASDLASDAEDQLGWQVLKQSLPPGEFFPFLLIFNFTT